MNNKENNDFKIDIQIKDCGDSFEIIYSSYISEKYKEFTLLIDNTYRYSYQILSEN